MSVYLWNVTAKEGETANGGPGGGTEVGRSPPGVPDLLPNPPHSPHQLFNPTLAVTTSASSANTGYYTPEGIFPIQSWAMPQFVQLNWLGWVQSVGGCWWR